MDCFRLVSTPVKSRWTIPLNHSFILFSSLVYMTGHIHLRIMYCVFKISDTGTEIYVFPPTGSDH